MSYFDSPKNRAMWERKLNDLREEKKRRMEEGYVPPEGKAAAADMEHNPHRRRINLEQLEQMELDSIGVRRVKRPVKATQKEQPELGEKKEPSLKGRQL